MYVPDVQGPFPVPDLNLRMFTFPKNFRTHPVNRSRPEPRRSRGGAPEHLRSRFRLFVPDACFRGETRKISDVLFQNYMLIFFPYLPKIVATYSHSRRVCFEEKKELKLSSTLPFLKLWNFPFLPFWKNFWHNLENKQCFESHTMFPFMFSLIQCRSESKCAFVFVWNFEIFEGYHKSSQNW